MKTADHEIADAAHTQAFSDVVRRLPATPQTTEALLGLIAQWEHRARCKFQSAEVQADESGRRFVEHGAWCYFNCAQELKVALVSALPQSSATPSEGQS